MSRSPNEDTRAYAGTAGLSTSDRHRVLAARHRRRVLDALAERTTPVDLETLAAAVAAREEGGADEETVAQVSISLHHTHLPLMADVGVVDYDPDATLVESLSRCPGSSDGS
jgi:hypothetical protein